MGARGFLVGTFVLVVVYVAVQPNTAKAAASGSNVLAQGLRRLLSPTVAGLPKLKSAASTTSTTSTTATTAPSTSTPPPSTTIYL